MGFNFSNFFLRAPDFGGRKPTNVNPSSTGMPAMATAAAAALGPGMGCTAMPSSAHAAARSAPGSATPGVPASETNANASPIRILSSSGSRRLRSLCAW